ncbi:dharma [Sebastes umbrosus]|uniref:dharma n=1 Tax=Sebastes umbrosus TaxID=72105 RepID=UPI0018A0B632|nr:dharma [Sebastes umbrosus]
MEGSRVSDFSIERILSHQLGHKLQPMMDFSSDGYLHPVPVPVPVPVPGCLQYRGGMSFGEAFYPYGGGFHHTNIYPNQGAYVTFSSQDSTDAPQLAGYHGYHHAHQLAGYHGYHRQQHPQPRQKARMRTVFTDSQTKRLEALFELTDYPTVEVRAEVARSTGLSEETVRVWFKNRRARRKRQRSGSKVKSPPSAAAEKKFFTSFL